MKMRLFSLLVALCCATSMFAYDAYIGGIYYNLDKSAKTAEVTNRTGSYNTNSYSGVVVIPSTITYNSQTYSVTTIGNYAFSYCSGLTSVTIPSSVTAIRSSAFSVCIGLKKTNYTGTIADWCKIKFGGGDANPMYHSHNFFINNVEVKDLVIPESVDAIGDLAFYGCSGLTSVTIPNSVTTIGEDAFYLCSGLTSVTIPNSVTTIGYHAFLHVNNIVYSGTATGSPWGAKCVNGYVEGYLVYSDATKTKICGCFSAAMGVVTIPSSVTTIGSSAFYDCSGLTKTNYTGTIADWCKIKFGDYDANPMYYSHNFFINNVEVKDLVIPDGITTVGNYAFSGCSGLTSVTIPSSVTTIGSFAFSGCSGLKKTNYTGTIADWCKIKFGGSTSNPMCYSHNFYINNVEVKDLVIPEGVDKIGVCAFSGCSGLTSVTIPNSVTTIGDYAFYYCSGLTSVTIGNSVTTIGNYAFSGCSGLTSVTIPNSVTTIGNGAFYGCSGLTSVTIPNSVTTIGSRDDFSGDLGAFEFVNNIVYSGTATGSPWGAKCVNGYVEGYLVYSDATKTKLCACSYAATEIMIPSSVTTIGNGAFSGCSGLTSVTIPSSVTTIGSNAFSDCSGLTKTNYTGTIAGWCKISFDYHANPMCYSHNFYINDVEVKDLVIPAGVTTIGNYAFCGCSSLKSVTIPNSVTTIGSQAFSGCSGLKKTNYTGTIADWCKIKFGSYDANPIYYSHNFYINDVEVKDLVIPEGVDTIGEYAFAGCSGLTSVTIPNSVTTIGGSAFSGCSGLTSVTIPNSVTTIGGSAFSGCSGLTSVTIPNSVTTIGGSAFYNCSGLTKTNYTGTIADWCKIKFGDNPISYSHNFYINDAEVKDLVIPDGVDTIGDYAFHNCDSLTSVTIGNSVTTIGTCAFYNCRGLTSITCYATTPPTCASYYSFEGVSTSIPVYVPAGSVNAYKQANEWKNFTNILPIGAEVVPTTDKVITQPSENSVTITWPQTDNADTYTLEIKKNGNLVCTLTFNSQGIMTNITFAAPARNGERTASAAEMTVNGYKFTITGLDSGTEYTYTVTAKNASAQPLQTYSGSFKTTTPTGLENLTIDQNVGNKFIYGNQLYIRRGDNIYNAAGMLMK